MFLLSGITLTLILISCGKSDKSYASSEFSDDPEVDYQQEGLDIHNEKRAIHHSPPLELSVELNAIAINCAHYYVTKYLEDELLVRSCPHASNMDLGENLEFRSRTWNASDATKDAIDKWYNELFKYGYDYTAESEHASGAVQFTQMVWKETTKVGIGHYNEGRNYVVVAFYEPRGNQPGEYGQNVLKP